jgi:hypothetical protein
MRRSTKIKIGITVFIVLCLIVGLTLYFVLRKKPTSSSQPSQHVRKLLSSSSSSTPYSRYQQSKPELKNLYQEIQDINSKLTSTITALQNIFNNNDNKPIDSDTYIKLYNEIESKIIGTIETINDIYTFIGDYDDSAHSFSVTKKGFQTEFVPDFMTKIQNYRKMVNQKGLAPHNYTGNVLSVFRQLQMSANALINYLNILLN